MRRSVTAIVTLFISLFLHVALAAQERITASEAAKYVGKTATVCGQVAIRLPKKATRAFVTQPKIAEVEVVAPDTLLIHGKAGGATSLVLWTEKP